MEGGENRGGDESLFQESSQLLDVDGNVLGASVLEQLQGELP